MANSLHHLACLSDVEHSVQEAVSHHIFVTIVDGELDILTGNLCFSYTLFVELNS